MDEYQTSVEELDDIEDEEEKGLILNYALKEVEEGLDEGEMLVIRRPLSGIASQDGLEQREYLSYSMHRE